MEGQELTPRKYADVTSEMIQDWKAKYNQEYLEEVSISNNGKDYKFIIKKPTRFAMDAMAQFGIEKNVSEANKTLIANTVLGGDLDAMEQDGGIYQALLSRLNVKAKDYKVEVKKL